MAATADPPVTRRRAGGREAAGSSSSRGSGPEDRGSGPADGNPVPVDGAPDDDTVPASSNPGPRWRRITSPAVAIPAATRDSPMAALANRPVRGFSGASSLSVTYGAIRLPIPIDRLARVSLSS